MIKHSRWVSITALIALGVIFFQFALYKQIWVQLPEQLTFHKIDYIIYNTAGRIINQGNSKDLYNFKVQEVTQRQISPSDIKNGQLLPFNHPPLLIPLLALITTDDYYLSYLRWDLILWLLIGLCCWILIKLLVQKGWRLWEASLVGLQAILFYPVFISVLIGQDTAFVLLGALLWMQAIQQENDWLASIGLGLLLLRPHLALALALPTFLIRRVTRKYLSIILILSGLESFILIGWGGIKDYINALIISAQGQGYGMNMPSMVNFTGFLLRVFPNIDILLINFLKWGGYLLTIVCICILWWKRKNHITSQLVGCSVLVSLFIAPHLHFHDLSLLLLPALATTGTSSNKLSWATFFYLIAGCSLLLIASHILNGARFYWCVFVVYLFIGYKVSSQ